MIGVKKDAKRIKSNNFTKSNKARKVQYCYRNIGKKDDWMAT